MGGLCWLRGSEVVYLLLGASHDLLQCCARQWKEAGVQEQRAVSAALRWWFVCTLSNTNMR